MNVRDVETIDDGVFVLRNTDISLTANIHVERVIAQAPLRHMTVPGGRQMSVGTTNCGELGWTSDRSGYRYSPVDPLTGKPWPKMPPPLKTMANLAAEVTFGPGFMPDACLINRYLPGTQMGMHRDTDEVDHSRPIVSLSLGLTARFALGGLVQGGRAQVILLHHGDIMVFGGPARLRYHGVRPLNAKDGTWPHRTNLTFRVAG